MLGSQVFDYWFDPSKFIVVNKHRQTPSGTQAHYMQEHYADGDLVNCETVVSYVQAGPQALKIWGPPVPDVF